jgi:anionic cell wall polymer biosynthesis LytR-Cps2A-Psr (LCP) family protein
MEPIDEVYAYGGASYTRNCLSDTLGLNIDRYVRLDREGFVAAAAAVGSIEFELMEPMELSQGEYQFKLAEGLQLLDGRKIAQIFQWDGYGTEEERYDMIAAITASIVEQRRDIAASTVVDRVFERIINMVDTDVYYADYSMRKAAGEYLANLEGPVTQIVEASGETLDDGAFMLSDTFIALLAKQYG